MLTTATLNSKELLSILDEALEFANGKTSKVIGEVFASNLFFENSTRTKTSFDVAERKLGLQVVPFDANTSSLKKGESLYDTVKTLESIGVNIAVIRHQQEQYYNELDGVTIPIVNGGDGKGDHPSQCMLDLMTIYQEFGSFEGLKIGIVGDVKHSRVAHSDSEALLKLGAEVYYSGPKEWFSKQDLENGNYMDIDTLVQEVDVLMLLRIQHERHGEKMNLSLEEYHQQFGLTKGREQSMKKTAIIMHPAPINRGVEIDTHLVECDKSRIFKQMQNGVFARMAILKNELEKKGYQFQLNK